MGVQVIDGLGAVLPLVENEPIAAGNPKLLGNFSRCIQDEHVVPALWHRRRPWNLASGRNHNMNRSLRIDVLKRDDMLVFVDDPRWNFAVDNLGKESRHALQV